MSRPDSIASSGRETQSVDLFEDENRIGAVLQSLIDQQKLQSAWQKVGGRLRTAEGTVKEAQERLDKLPQEYVALPAYQELVENKHARLLTEHGEALNRLHELTSRLAETVFDNQKSQLQDCTERLQKQEEQQAQMQQEAQDSVKRFEEFRDEVKGRLGASDYQFQEHRTNTATERKEMADKAEEGFQSLWERIRGLEVSLQAYTRGEITKALKDALNFDRGGVGEINTKLLQMVDRELVDSVRGEQKKAFERLVKLGGDLEQQRSELIRQIRVAEQKAADATSSINAHKKEMSADLEKRPYQRDVRELEHSVRKELNGLSHTCEGLQTRTVLKLNEFVDHVGKLHETIDDHEHCLRHHAEEIENRSTKYDLLLCQSQIDKCVANEDWNAELSDLKKVINWQTNKIENFGLTIVSSSKGRQPKRRLARDKQRHSVISNASVMDFASNDLLETSLDEGIENPEIEDVATGRRPSETSDAGASPRQVLRRQKTAELMPSAEEGVEEEEEEEVAHAGKAEDEGSVEHDPTPDQESLEPATRVPSLAPSVEEEEEDNGSVASMSTSSLLRQQVEAVAMGLVGLAHLTLSDPKLGMSSQDRKNQKTDLLEQLQDLRHWITHKAAPSGWDPSKLTTIALRFATHSSSAYSDRPKRAKRRSTAPKATATSEEECSDGNFEKKRETKKSVAYPSGKHGGAVGDMSQWEAARLGRARRNRPTMAPIHRVGDDEAGGGSFVVTGGGHLGSIADADKAAKQVRRSVIQETGADRNSASGGSPANTAGNPASARQRGGGGSKTMREGSLPPLARTFTKDGLSGTAPATAR